MRVCSCACTLVHNTRKPHSCSLLLLLLVGSAAASCRVLGFAHENRRSRHARFAVPMPTEHTHAHTHLAKCVSPVCRRVECARARVYCIIFCSIQQLGEAASTCVDVCRRARCTSIGSIAHDGGWKIHFTSTRLNGKRPVRTQS